MSKVTKDLIIDRINHYDTFVKGAEYYNSGKVREVKSTPSQRYYEANIYGKNKYETSVEFNSTKAIKSTYCSCRDYQTLPGDCKHIVALLMLIMDYENTGNVKKQKSEGDIKNIIDYYRENLVLPKTSLNIELNFSFEYSTPSLDIRVGEDKLYVVKNLGKFIDDVQKEKLIEFGKKFTYYPDSHKFRKEDQELIEFLTILYENYEANGYNTYGSGYYNTFKGNKVYFTPKTLERFFKIIENRPFNLKMNNEELENIYIINEDIEIDFKLIEKNDDLILQLGNLNIRPLLDNWKYVYYNGNIHKLSKEQANTLRPLFKEVNKRDVKNIRIEKELKNTFVSEILPIIKKHSNLEIDKTVEELIYSHPLQSNIYFDKKGDIIIGKVIFNYGEIDINPFTAEDISKTFNKILLRDVEKERTVMSFLEHGDFKVGDGGFYLQKEEEIFDFINDVIPELQKHSEIYYSENFKNIKLIKSNSIKAGIRLNGDLDILEFDFDIDGIDKNQIADLFKNIKQKKRYFKLKNGSFLSLNNKDFNDMMDMMEYLDLNPDDFKDGVIDIPKFRTMYLDRFINTRELNFIKKNVDFKKLVRDINDPEDIEYEISKELNADLRDYQKFGFKWLKTLSNYGFGGILADEMGLGKTIQIISYLLSEKKEKNQYPSIVIVPTSLVYNWEEEVKKFAPTMRTLVIAGNKSERTDLISDSQSYDLLITSYPLIRRDIEEYENLVFSNCILDEAQYIKNQDSINAKSVKKIKAKNYFALTGTPMENALSELWSIFDFLMPGYLLNYGEFVEKYERPIAKESDKEKLKELSNQIKPFILRRTKKEVLKELPDKIEQKILVDMSTEQKKLYLAYLESIKGEINQEVNEKGFGRSHIKILAALTRLRQICCDPEIFVDDYTGGSGKLDVLEEIVSEAVGAGHRILIFSQFTTMLKKINTVLEANKIESLYLDGSTPIMDRRNLVRDFNRGIGDVFLISLKAGGTGLNLTSADMVIHFDPWWNPAVEDQATDRAHRIGQEETVQVIKLVTKGSIEEKIFTIQERKKEMIDKVIKEGETLINKLSEDELMSLFEM